MVARVSMFGFSVPWLYRASNQVDTNEEQTTYELDYSTFI